jgi:hypothetical protein
MRRKSNLDKLLLGVVILLVAQVIELSIKLLFLPKAPGIEIGYLDWRRPFVMLLDNYFEFGYYIGTPSTSAGLAMYFCFQIVKKLGLIFIFWSYLFSYYIDETPLNISRCWRLGRLLLIPVIYFFYHLGEQYGIIDNTLSTALFYHIMKFIFSKNLFIGIFGFFVFLYVLQNPNWESTDPRKAKSLRDYLNRRHNQEMYERSKAQTRKNVTLFTLIIGLLTFKGLRRLRVYLKEIRSF